MHSSVRVIDTSEQHLDSNVEIFSNGSFFTRMRASQYELNKHNKQFSVNVNKEHVSIPANYTLVRYFYVPIQYKSLNP